MTTSEPQPEAIPQDPRIRPFTVEYPQADLDDLKRRVRETRWPDKEIVDDASQGVQLAGRAGARAVLGGWPRLADGRGSTQRAAPVRHRDRRASTSISSTSARSTRTRCR